MRAAALSAAIGFALSLHLCPIAAREPTDEAAMRSGYLDQAGVVRWRDNNDELALFGANYCIMSGSDYRMAGLVSKDRKAMIDEDLAHFARMGWTALRLCSWGDWENSDRAGNLIVNEHVDLLDYVIAKARERGIYLLLTPIHTYNPAFADQLGQPSANVGFSRYFERAEMGTNPQSIAAQVNYIKQLLNHVNPYTGVALKQEPALLFVEMINEPVHHPEDLAGSVRYIDALVKAVRDTGSRQITFFNVSQDFAIAKAIERSHVDGVTFGWYPTGLVAGHTLRGNFLQAVEAYPDMLRPELRGRPRIVYEFDTADLLSGYMYPAMARTYRSVGAQLATMFAYDMLETAPFNLGWQTHYLNLVHTPRKAVSTVIAAEAMRRLPRLQSYGRYPDSTHFGDFRVSYADDMSELNADDAFMNAGATADRPRNFETLRHIAGVESSGAVSYEGSGAYFLDKIADGTWRLELYPDEVLVRDPFEQPRPDKVVSRLLYRDWQMTLHLPDLGADFYATPITVPGAPAPTARQAAGGRVAIEPGVWILSRLATLDRASLPARVARVGIGEYHVNAPVAYPDLVLPMSAAEFVAGSAIELRARAASSTLPDLLQAWVRPAGLRSFVKPVDMKRVHGNDYAATLAAESLAPGLYEYVVSARSGDKITTFPGALTGEPGKWPFFAPEVWSFRITPASTAIRLLDPKSDYSQLQFVRPGEQYRGTYFRIAPGERSDESALSITLPDLGRDTPARYATDLFVGDRLGAHRADAAGAKFMDIRLRAVGGAHRDLDVALIERDGSSWHAFVTAGPEWTTVAVPLADLRAARSILIPSPFPALWDYWREGPVSRATGEDRIRPDDVERLQLTLQAAAGADAALNSTGVAVESIALRFPDVHP